MVCSVLRQLKPPHGVKVYCLAIGLIVGATLYATAVKSQTPSLKTVRIRFTFFAAEFLPSNARDGILELHLVLPDRWSLFVDHSEIGRGIGDITYRRDTEGQWYVTTETQKDLAKDLDLTASFDLASKIVESMKHKDKLCRTRRLTRGRTRLCTDRVRDPTSELTYVIKWWTSVSDNRLRRLDLFLEDRESRFNGIFLRAEFLDYNSTIEIHPPPLRKFGRAQRLN